ncbi:MAG: DUF481 domain-containing protein [Gemmatimonadota bacterium]|nr:MAG: DUF481 domain-containing protein [Gemmatimonadota bacterium]
MSRSFLCSPTSCGASSGFFAMVLAALLHAVPAQAQKTDVVVLQNGDHITGEIKVLERGKLSYSTDDMGTLSIEWDQVDRVTSVHYFEVELRSGLKYFGAIPPAATGGRMVVALDVFSDTLDLAQVVRIVPIESEFFERINGYIDAGISFFKANSYGSLSLSVQATYRGRKAWNRVSFSSYVQTRQGERTASRSTLGYRLQYFLPSRWSVLGFLSAEQNSEINLDLRVLGGLGGARFLAQTNHVIMQALAGLLITNERSTGVEESKNNLEAALGAEVDWFRYNSPKLDISADLTVFPGITDLGRVRIEFETRAKYELISDFTVGLTFWDSFDSRPLSGERSSNDFGTEFTVGYTF